MIGVATAAASSVAVIAQAVSAADACSSRGSSGTSGITRVCISATVIPAEASTGTTAPVRTGAGGASPRSVGVADIGSLRDELDSWFVQLHVKSGS